MTLGRAFYVAGIVLAILAALSLFGVIVSWSLATGIGLACLAIACLCAAPLV